MINALLRCQMLFNHFNILSNPPATGETAWAPTRNASQHSHFSVCILKSNSNCMPFMKMFSIWLSVSLTSPPPWLGFPLLSSSWTRPSPVETLLATDTCPILTCLLFLQISPTVNPLLRGQKLQGKSSFTLYHQFFLSGFHDHPSAKFRIKTHIQEEYAWTSAHVCQRNEDDCN